jgi:threonine dehydratase
MNMLKLPTYDDAVQATVRIAGTANHTPVLTSCTVNEEFGAELFFKCENIQRMGAFKFRGPIILRGVDDILTMADDELLQCMRFFSERMKIVARTAMIELERGSEGGRELHPVAAFDKAARAYRAFRTAENS